jgi:hypothetical protein
LKKSSFSSAEFEVETLKSILRSRYLKEHTSKSSL